VWACCGLLGIVAENSVCLGAVLHVCRTFSENGMGRCLSLLGMMVFTVGVVALSSLARGAAQPAALPQNDTPKTCGCPRPAVMPALSFHAPFSLN
jgi:hypothetical protein